MKGALISQFGRHNGAHMLVTLEVAWYPLPLVQDRQGRR